MIVVIQNLDSFCDNFLSDWCRSNTWL